jgi:hypothetical protein
MIGGGQDYPAPPLEAITMSDVNPHDQLKADLSNIGYPDASNVEVKTHIHSKVSIKVKTESGILVFKNGILVEINNLEMATLSEVETR